ncbi:hypothetical protein [Nocardia terpenica]|uniref:hypothetical protein n=1 Tax=Nocardia terpenica TaxID=455432 RepID=UPI002FE15732
MHVEPRCASGTLALPLWNRYHRTANADREKDDYSDMSLKSGRAQRFSVRTGVVAAATIGAVIGLTGPAAAGTTDPAVQFTPTLTRLPGSNCAAIINAETTPQPRSGEFAVKVTITRTGESCGAFRIAVNWRNLDSGSTGGQSDRVDENGVLEQPGGVITGMGMGPGRGRVEAWIDPTDESYPQRQDLEHIAGTVSVTLG